MRSQTWFSFCAHQQRTGLPGSRSTSAAASWFDTLPLDSHCNRISATKTQRGDTAMHITADHLVDQRDQDPRPTGSDRMADGNGSAVNVHFVGIEAELAHHTERLD